MDSACISSSQQDAQEFLRFLLDKLHTEINRRPNVRKTGKEPEQKYARFRSASRHLASLKPFVPHLTSTFLRFLTTNQDCWGGSCHVEEALGERWQYNSRWEKRTSHTASWVTSSLEADRVPPTIICVILLLTELFSGQLRSSLHCSVCSHYSNTFDVFCDLSLPIPKRSSGREVTLWECLDLFSQEEKLDKENSPVSWHRVHELRALWLEHTASNTSVFIYCQCKSMTIKYLMWPIN